MREREKINLTRVTNNISNFLYETTQIITFKFRIFEDLGLHVCNILQFM